MPMHDWTRVEAGIYHAFHHEWISEISRALNRGLLPDSYYALPEQVAAGFGPDVLTLRGSPPDEGLTKMTQGAAPPQPSCCKPIHKPASPPRAKGSSTVERRARLPFDTSPAIASLP